MFVDGAALVILTPLVLGMLVAVNTLQNGAPDLAAPRLTSELRSARDVASSCPRKRDVVALWRSGVAVQPGTIVGKQLRGSLLTRGILSPASALITHALFAPGHAWTGKMLEADGTGTNVFAGNRRRRRFGYSIQRSALDGKPALTLVYKGHDGVFGNMLGMRDEIRALPDHPRILIGMGSMAATGGVRNAAPFVLEVYTPKER